MIPEKLKEIMKKDGVVAIATLGPDGPHMVVLSSFLCKIFMSQFLEERQVLTHFSYGV